MPLPEKSTTNVSPLIRVLTHPITLSIAITTLCLYPVLWWEDIATPYHYLMRDFLRGQSIANGHWIWHGAELNYGGYLPGPAYYYILAVPQLFSSTPVSSVYMAFIAFSIAAGSLFYYFYRYVGFIAALVSVYMLNTSKVYIDQLRSIWNPTFTIPLNALIGILALKSIEHRNKKFLFWAAFTIGIGIQIHFSMIVHVFTIVFIYCYNFRTEMWKDRIYFIGKSIGLIILPCVPYLVWFTSKFSFSDTATVTQSQSLYFENVMRTFKIAAKYFLKRFEPSMLDAFIVFAIPLLFYFKFSILEKQFHIWKNFIFILLLHTLVSLPLMPQLRYLLPFQIYHILLVALSAQILYSFLKIKYKPLAFIFPIILVLFCSYKLFATNSSNFKLTKDERITLNYDFEELNYPFMTNLLSDYLDITRRIYLETNWTPEEFEDRVFHTVSITFELGTYYRHLYHQKVERTNSKAAYSGVLIFPINSEYNGQNRDWLNKFGVPNYILEFLFSDKTTTIKSTTHNNLKVLYYKVNTPADEIFLPRNMGVTFVKRPIEDFIATSEVPVGEIKMFEGPAADTITYVWNISKHVEWPRRMGLVVSGRRQKDHIDLSFTIQSALLRLTFPNQDNFFDQLFIGGLKIHLGTQTMTYPKALGDPEIPSWSELVGNYNDDLFKLYIPTTNARPPSYVSPIVRKSILYCDSLNDTTFEITIDDLLVMKNRSYSIDLQEKNIKKTLVLPKAFLERLCASQEINH